MQSVEVSEGPSRATRFLKLHACDVAEFNLAPHDMSQHFFECLCSVESGGSTICQHFLQSRCAMADTPEEEVVEPQELEGDVPRHGLASVGHGVREVHHILVDPQSYLAACCITMRKVSILMSQNRAKGILTEARKKSEAHHQRAPPFILAALATCALFVDRHLDHDGQRDVVVRARDIDELPVTTAQ